MLAPEQVRILPISERHHEKAREIYQQLFDAGMRVEIDERSEKIGYKIREAQLQKIPYMLIIGDKEAESGTVSVRRRGEGDLGAVKTEAISCHRACGNHSETNELIKGDSI